MQVIGIVGRSDTGKTSFVERLVPELAGRGSVATVKSIHHDVEVDEPGKDTHRHRAAGAAAVVGITPDSTFQVRTGGKRAAIDAGGEETDALRDALVSLANDGFDYAVVEGFSEAAIPILVTEPDDRPSLGGTVVAAVPDRDVEAHVDAVDDARPFHTASSLAETVDADGAVVAVTTDVLDTERTPDEWRTEGSLSAGAAEDAFATLTRELDARTDVLSATTYVRPPVTPGERATVHIAVATPERSGAVATTEGARERLGELWPAFRDGDAVATVVV
jgi:molybdopterin-guanine dinucleotide biosynthesis protein B